MNDQQQMDKLKQLLAAAYDKLKILQNENEKNKVKEPIAIIGMACRLPGNANTPDEFWNNLKNKFDSVSDIPEERWNIEDFYSPDPSDVGKSITKSAAFIDDIFGFDSSFFEISPLETRTLDPQQRLLLEVSWESLENAGLNIEKLRGSRTGVYVGMCGSDYQRQLTRLPADKIERYIGTGTFPYSACGRLSYFYDFHGPSVPIDTACSSSLVGLHYAVNDLYNGESDMALVLGVNALLDPNTFIVFSKLQALSKDGRCKTFSAEADGYGRGEGCSGIVLKRLSDAKRDNDRILGLICATSVSQDGKGSGLTAPNPMAQEQLLIKTINKAGLKIDDIDYVETHGTGTSLGDPIEIEALTRVFKNKKNPLLIGSVKTNICHQEAGAGLAGLLKILLSLNHNEIPASLHSDNLNPHINWNSIPLKIVNDNMHWESNGKRYAGVSSFGIAGTLSHSIISTFSDDVRNNDVNKLNDYLLTFSAKSLKALKGLKEKYLNYLQNTNDDIRDICYTSNISRTLFDYRVAISGKSKSQVLEQLREYQIDSKSINENIKVKPKIAFLFTGQGSQYPKMGQTLFENYPVFKSTMEICDIKFQALINTSIINIIYSDDNNQQILNRTDITQPVIFSIEYSLFKLYESWGVRPSIVAGHSIGQYAAACSAGIFSLDDAIKIVSERGKLFNSVEHDGGMVVLFTNEDNAKRCIDNIEDAYVAAVNAPKNITIAGYSRSIDKVIQKAENEKIKFKRLEVSGAFHTPLLNSITDKFKHLIKEVKYGNQQIPIISDLTGNILDQRNTNFSDYFVDQITQPIRFHNVFEQLFNKEVDLCIELGGNPVLTNLGNLYDKESVFFQSALHKKKDDWEQTCKMLQFLYLNGVNIDWEAVYGKNKGTIVSLPTYSFQKEYYKIEFDDLNYLDTKKSESSETEVNNLLFHLVPDEMGPLQSLTSDMEIGDVLLFIPESYIDCIPQLELINSKIKYHSIINGSVYKKIKPSVYMVNSTDNENLELLFRDLEKEDVIPKKAIYLWGIETESNHTSESLIDEQKLVTTELTNVIQNLSIFKSICKLWIVTKKSGFLNLVENHDLNYSQSTLMGIGKALEIEKPELYGGIIDIDFGISESKIESLVWVTESFPETQVVVNDDKCFQPRLKRLDVSKKKNSINVTSLGVYIITGGMGSLGLQFAKALISKGARHLVLVGRNKPSLKTIEIIDSMKINDIEIDIVNIDISINEDVDKLIQSYNNPDIPIKGVIHAAGIMEHKLFDDQDWSNYYNVFKAKILGTWNLYHSLKSHNLDFFVLFSSASTVMGLVGHNSYVAANEFVNSFTQKFNTNHNMISINWGPWNQQNGNGMNSNMDVEISKSIGINSLNINHFEEYIDSIFSSNEKILYFLDMDWNLYKDFMSNSQKNGIFKNLIDKDEKQTESSILLSIANKNRHEQLAEIQKILAEICAKVLGFEEASRISFEIPLMEQGADSIMAVEIRTGINQKLKIKVYATIIFDYPTIKSIAEYIIDKEIPKILKINNVQNEDFGDAFNELNQILLED